MRYRKRTRRPIRGPLPGLVRRIAHAWITRNMPAYERLEALCLYPRAPMCRRVTRAISA